MSMIKLTVSNNLTRNTVIVNSESTLRSVVEANGIDFASGMLSLDGSTLPVGGLDKTFDDYDIDPNVQHYLMRVAKADNAASAVVSGNALVVTTAITYEDLMTTKKYRPEALVLYKDKEPIFNMDVSKDPNGAINSFGACFGSRVDADGHATITVQIPENVTDIRSWAEDYAGRAMLNVNKIECQLFEAMPDISNERQAISEAIIVI